MDRPTTPGEIDQRVAVLRRLKSHLLAQRDTFERYLDVLDREEDAISEGDLERLGTHVELERAIIAEIYAFQKVIDPLTDLYRLSYPLAEPEVPKLQASLERVKAEVLARNERNRKLLRESLDGLRREIASLRTPKRARSPYGDVPAPSMIDITT